MDDIHNSVNPTTTTVTAGPGNPFGRVPGRGDAISQWLLGTAALVSIATTLAIIATLGYEAINFLRAVGPTEFFFGTEWAPTFADAAYGVLPLLTATAVVTGIAMIVGAPMGLGLAVYLAEYSSERSRNYIKPVVEVLAGIPSIVLGYFALTLLTPEVIQPIIPGTGVFNQLAAGIAVGVLITPVIASLCDDALTRIPQSLREAAYGLGAQRSQAVMRVIIPAAAPGLGAALLLGMSRALGETMVVAVAAGQLAQLTADVREPAQTMTGAIAQLALGDASTGSSAYLSLFALGATLFAITFAINAAASGVVRRMQEQYE